MDEIKKDPLKEAIEKQFDKLRNQSIALGYRVACTTILQMIEPWHNQHASHNDYKRLFKQVEKFCQDGLKHKDDEENNTKLMEESE